MLKIFNYPGIKLQYCPLINSIINEAKDVDTFVEPFCGTASVLINLSKDFKKKVVNDLSPDIIRILKSFRDGNYEQLVKMYNDIASEFGNIKDSKEAYYNFRNVYNSRYYNNNKCIEKGFFLHIASRAAINSLFRVGPNGFNQSYGRRGNLIKMTKQEFDEIQKILLDTIFYTESYNNIIDIYDDKNVLFFLDPPYVDRKIKGSYKDENLFDQNKFLNIIGKAKGKIIYTDIYDETILERLEFISGYKWNYQIFVNKQNISPGKNKETKIDYRETIYYNF